MIEWNIGCSGYYYSGWKKSYYPEGLAQRKWFEYYTTHFNAVELNVTYYRFPKLETLLGLYARSANHFKFSVKVPRVITNYKRFTDAQGVMSDFYEIVKDGFREKLGCILFQFPSSFEYTEDRLAMLVTLLDHSYTNVVEFRHVSWWREEVYDILRKHSITFCSMSHPILPPDVIKTTDIIYYRFHGTPRLYHSQYDIENLQRVADQVSEYKDLKQAYISFNNTAEGVAITNAQQMQQCIDQMLIAK